jgi:hypothetical protein
MIDRFLMGYVWHTWLRSGLVGSIGYADEKSALLLKMN